MHEKIRIINKAIFRWPTFPGTFDIPAAQQKKWTHTHEDLVHQRVTNHQFVEEELTHLLPVRYAFIDDFQIAVIRYALSVHSRLNDNM